MEQQETEFYSLLLLLLLPPLQAGSLPKRYLKVWMLRTPDP
jgi:hypothetical protein